MIFRIWCAETGKGLNTKMLRPFLRGSCRSGFQPFEIYGVSDGTWTRDLMGHNHVLYRLSYAHHVFACSLLWKYKITVNRCQQNPEWVVSRGVEPVGREFPGEISGLVKQVVYRINKKVWFKAENRPNKASKMQRAVPSFYFKEIRLLEWRPLQDSNLSPTD